MTRREEILEVAARVLDLEGPAALTMRRVAEELGIAAPSLYKHVRDKDEIEAALQQRALAAMGQALAGADPDLYAIARAYRTWATNHPRLYALGTDRPLRRDQLDPGVEASAAAPLVAAVGGDEHAARAVWAAMHGLVILELAERFPPGADLDRTWHAAVSRFASTGSDAPVRAVHRP